MRLLALILCVLLTASCASEPVTETRIVVPDVPAALRDPISADPVTETDPALMTAQRVLHLAVFADRLVQDRAAVDCIMTKAEANVAGLQAGPC